MDTDGKKFDTNVFFSGGAGMFLQYHDVIKPVQLYAITKMIIMGESFGLPIDIIKQMSIFSIIEWYINRRFINPFMCLDYMHQVDSQTLDNMMLDYLTSDNSLYTLSPLLNISKMLEVYHKQHMSFPIYVYSEYEEPFIKEDCKNSFPGIPIHYVHGDLKSAIGKCDQNFTYIFSDIELVKKASEILVGTCSHVLLTREYRYNYLDNHKTFKYDLNDMVSQYPFVRIGTTMATDIVQLTNSFRKLNVQEGT